LLLTAAGPAGFPIAREGELAMTDSTNDTTYGSARVGGWEAVGIPLDEALAWARAGYRPNEAADWRDAGALDPGTAADWERYGFTPSTAEPWLTIGEVGPADAITMREAGMTPAECARIRAGDPRCVIVVTDEHGRTRMEQEPPAVGF
jgi:hypothetical protein